MEIAALKRKHNQETDLEEDVKLRQLVKEFEELVKIREEQDEKAATVRQVSNEMNERMKAVESEIAKHDEDIDKKNKEIQVTKADAKAKEEQQKQL